MTEPWSGLPDGALDGLNALAEQAIGLSDPNPRVACRLLLLDGRVFEGHTQAAGGPHAEVMALRAARAAGADLRGATALVTLEPCSHHGRTPPCCDALIEAGIARVVVALQDPNPLVGGQGLDRLRAAGLQVDLLPSVHPLAQDSRELNIGFLSRMVRHRPWVRLKTAASLDGTTALPNGVSQWITGPEARADGHAWRRRANAVLTGIGTVLADNPRLDVRLVPTQHQPMRVVLDSQLQTPPSAQLLHPPGTCFIYTTAGASTERRAALEAMGATVVVASGASHDQATASVNLGAVLIDLAQRGVNELHVEAGHRLSGAFWRAGLVDEGLFYLAPTLLGPGAGLAQLGPFTHLEQGVHMDFIEAQTVGRDLRVRTRVPSA